MATALGWLQHWDGYSTGMAAAVGWLVQRWGSYGSGMATAVGWPQQWDGYSSEKATAVDGYSSGMATAVGWLVQQRGGHSSGMARNPISVKQSCALPIPFVRSKSNPVNMVPPECRRAPAGRKHQHYIEQRLPALLHILTLL